MITQSQLKELIHYCPDTGVFTRISSPYKAKLGVIKTCSNGNGYFQITLLGKAYLAHRLAWLYMHGKFPEEQLDHINGNKIYNRLLNLREATHAENMQNVGAQRNNKSGFKGVSYYKRYSKWRARIRADGKLTHLGHYNTPELASQAYEAAAKTIHGVFYYKAEN